MDEEIELYDEEIYSNWMEKLYELGSHAFPSMEDVHEESYNTKSEDIGLVHPIHGAGFLIRENKRVECFADYGMGFRIDPENQSLSIYAPNIRLHANSVRQMEYDNSTYFVDENEQIMKLLKEGS